MQHTEHTGDTMHTDTVITEQSLILAEATIDGIVDVMSALMAEPYSEVIDERMQSLTEQLSVAQQYRDEIAAHLAR